MDFFEKIKKLNWQVECDLIPAYGAMTVRVDFFHRDNPTDSTEFCINPWDAKELAELFGEFCRENGFKNMEPESVTVVRVAENMHKLAEMEGAGDCNSGYFQTDEELCSRFYIVRDGKELYLTMEELRDAYYEQQRNFDRMNIDMNMESYLNDAMYDYIRGDGDVFEKFIDCAATELRRQQDKYDYDYETALEGAFRYAEKQFRPKLFIDMDGTMARFIPTSVENLYKTGYFLNLPVLQNVVDAIRLIIQEHKEVDVYLLSCVLGEQAKVEKDAWMSVYLPELREEKRIFLPNGENKWQYVQKKLFGYSTAKNAFLLDDHTPNLMKWAPGKAIKLMNDINGRGGTWKGSKVSYDMDPETLAAEILKIVKA